MRQLSGDIVTPEDKVKIVYMPDFVYTILDTYGIYDYSTGRAVRTLGSTQAPVFDINDWFIRKPEEAIDTDPRVWQDTHCPVKKMSSSQKLLLQMKLPSATLNCINYCIRTQVGAMKHILMIY